MFLRHNPEGLRIAGGWKMENIPAAAIAIAFAVKRILYVGQMTCFVTPRVLQFGENVRTKLTKRDPHFVDGYSLQRDCFTTVLAGRKNDNVEEEYTDTAIF